MNITVTDTALLTPTGGIASNTPIKIVCLEGYDQVLTGAISEFTTDDAGAYSFPLYYGVHAIYVRFDTKFKLLGKVTITSELADTATISDLLLYTEPMLPDEIALVSGLVEEARGYAEDAESAATQAGERLSSYEVETTEYLINTFDSSALGVGDIVKTLGYSSKGDGGAAEWIKTGDTGTPGQSPIDLIDGMLTDINGTAFSLYGDVSVIKLGALSVADSTDSFQSAVNALPDDGGYVYVGGAELSYVTSSPELGDKHVVFSGEALINSQKVWSIGGVQESYIPSLNRKVFVNTTDEYLTGNVDQDFIRNANYTGGATGNPNTLMRVFTDVASTVGGDPSGEDGNGRKAEWAFQARIDNNSNWANAVAVTGQARRYGTGASWSGQFNSLDYTTTDTHATRAIEANIQADGEDTNGLRWIVEAIAHNIDASYTGSDSINAAFKATAHTSSLKYGYTAEGTDGQGSITSAAFHASIEGSTVSMMEAINSDSSVKTKRYTLNDSGFVSEDLFYGRNSADENVLYGRFRAGISTNTDGSEKGYQSILVSLAGAEKTVFSASGDSDAISILVGNSLQRVSAGANDSGGTGFRSLLVANI